jgi:putative transcriptional regulator
MSKLFEEMAQGTAEARAYMEGKRKGYKVTLPETVDVRGLRKRLRLSQGRFADNFGLSVDAVRHWESGRRQPEAAARALLVVIAADPEFVRRSLAVIETLAPATSAKKRPARAAQATTAKATAKAR